MTKVGISGCLGCFPNCRYDGGGFNDFDLDKAKNYLKKELNTDEVVFIPVCPEQLGGLPTPRTPAEIVGGDGYDVWEGKARVVDKNGKDVTENFKRGAKQALEFFKKFDIKVFLSKDKSPSCGANEIYSGKFDGTKNPGKGVTAALLDKNGIRVFSDSDIK
jgi:uncharacterized protein YbbK (DUF523 family)